MKKLNLGELILETDNDLKYYYWEQPRGHALSMLLELALKNCNIFSLLVKDYCPKVEIIKELETYCIDVEINSVYQGKYFYYNFNDETCKIINRYYFNGIYDCINAELPEDLSFYISKNIKWLTTISHEYLSKIHSLEDLNKLMKIVELNIEETSEMRPTLSVPSKIQNIKTKKIYKSILWDANHDNDLIIPSCDYILILKCNIERNCQDMFYIDFNSFLHIYRDLIEQVLNAKDTYILPSENYKYSIKMLPKLIPYAIPKEIFIPYNN